MTEWSIPLQAMNDRNLNKHTDSAKKCKPSCSGNFVKPCTDKPQIQTRDTPI
ncbi:hypothetical protein PQZ64_gp63 [Klebsiella phage vB_KpnM_IME346]|uniref:Uncharacterized protein n=1 Tax=Klebsiella phage vB_KpnM_IME346 TaxID=2562174 RepID=A0A4D6DSA0_9CAUD|nr:hypothetical protein PQZ64_gp63 [Klebsiella phage vB_KpnM_IME346]QBZ68962.1 hypothetical protein [Klebsiella phage vB_KpnM_IME346]